MYSKYYKRFLDANPGVQHFACHSNYYWPDVTRQAVIDYWDDSARLVDAKWDMLFGTKVPEAQGLIAEALNLSSPEQIVFAPNTHEFVYRILSCFEPGKPLTVVTTDSEFYSFNRQIDRIAEMTWLNVVKVPSMPFEDFEARFNEAIHHHSPGLVFFSQVFFNSGVAVKNYADIIKTAHGAGAMVVMDAYHGFMAVPTDLSIVEDMFFYLAGSYKYAQGGEGACFLHIPKGTKLRPIYTGWFAEFGSLSKAKDEAVSYADDGMRFAGSTMDMTAIYRLIATLRLFKDEGIEIRKISQYLQERQYLFLEEIDKYKHPYINRERLLMLDPHHHGGFLTFRFDTAEQVSDTAAYLAKHKVITDFRGDRLRFGVALYHEGSYDLSCLEGLG